MPVFACCAAVYRTKPVLTSWTERGTGTLSRKGLEKKREKRDAERRNATVSVGCAAGGCGAGLRDALPPGGRGGEPCRRGAAHAAAHAPASAGGAAGAAGPA
eukprot:1143676-Pyramimonas_sp.AAC.1